jgi:hypothetical protein
LGDGRPLLARATTSRSQFQKASITFMEMLVTNEVEGLHCMAEEEAKHARRESDGAPVLPGGLFSTDLIDEESEEDAEGQ